MLMNSGAKVKIGNVPALSLKQIPTKDLDPDGYPRSDIWMVASNISDHVVAKNRFVRRV